nr:hypothetical protein KitaXyl93_06320 [Kitasatospora sp. Xyl93]
MEFTEADQVVRSPSSSKIRSVNAAFNVSFALKTEASILSITAPGGVGTALPPPSGLLSRTECVSTQPRSFDALPSMAWTTFFAVALAELGFWPVTRLPSVTT